MEIIQPGHVVQPKDHFYPTALNATMHPTLKLLVHMNNAELSKRYCQRHPEADHATLSKIMNSSARYYRWGGADLIRSMDTKNRRKMIVIEMNSCPSGNKSVPYLGWGYEGFRRVMANAFTPLINQSPVTDGGLAVFYDVKKQRPESYAYACMLAQIVNEPVYLVDVGYDRELPPFVRWTSDGVCQLDINYAGRAEGQNWLNLKAVFRYVTRRPWLKLPLLTKTLVLNPVVACLAGGRNKLLAAKAYAMFNETYADAGLQIHIPMTITNVVKDAIPEYARRMNHKLVVKVPYSNCGVGVYTITSPKELDEFMNAEHTYDRFVVQGLISHPSWPSSGSEHELYHVGCRPSGGDAQDRYVADLRFMVCSSPDGWMPVAVYSRRAELPLRPTLDEQSNSWQMLGTNLSIGEDGTSGTDTSRLMLLDTKTFPDMELDLDDLVECYVQTVLAATAVDDLCKQLMTGSEFDLALFRKWDDDRALLMEVVQGCPRLAEIHPELKHLDADQNQRPAISSVTPSKNADNVLSIISHSCSPIVVQTAQAGIPVNPEHSVVVSEQSSDPLAKQQSGNLLRFRV